MYKISPSLLINIIILIPLSGCLPIAAVSSYGVGTSIAEERSVGSIVGDTAIMTKIKNEFAQNDINNLLSRISVTVTEGRVLLTGSVPEHKYLELASELAWRVRGVKEVMNEIEVANKDLRIRARDSYIASQIKAKYLFDKDIKSVNYTIDVNNGIVYLAGIAQNQAELDLALQIASKVRGVKKVVSHLTLKDDKRRIEK